MTTVAAALAAAREQLAAAGVPSPDVDARALLRHVLGLRPEQLAVAAAAPLRPTDVAAFEDLVARRASRTPLQRLIGRTGFRYLDIEVAPGVFIPRPETEILVDLVLASLPDGGLVVEPCTGSGAVAAAIADERPDARIVATDIDPRAVTAARRATARFGGRVEVHGGDLLEPLDTRLRGTVDVLVSNPPYLAARELDDLEPEVTGGDPHAALVAGVTGHEVSDRLVQAAVRWLRPGGSLALEVDERRAVEVAHRCRGARLAEVTVHADLTGAARFVTALRTDGDLCGGSAVDAYSWQS